jgi:hypothetical protein
MFAPYPAVEMITPRLLPVPAAMAHRGEPFEAGKPGKVTVAPTGNGNPWKPPEAVTALVVPI